MALYYFSNSLLCVADVLCLLLFFINSVVWRWRSQRQIRSINWGILFTFDLSAKMIHAKPKQGDKTFRLMSKHFALLKIKTQTPGFPERSHCGFDENVGIGWGLNLRKISAHPFCLEPICWVAPNIFIFFSFFSFPAWFSFRAAFSKWILL